MNRREFIAAGAAAALSSRRVAARPIDPSSVDAGQPGIDDICVFSKHLQWLDFREMASAAREIGFDGIDLTVRPGGHVDPARVVEDLPDSQPCRQGFPLGNRGQWFREGSILPAGRRVRAVSGIA